MLDLKNITDRDKEIKFPENCREQLKRESKYSDEATYSKGVQKISCIQCKALKEVKCICS